MTPTGASLHVGMFFVLVLTFGVNLGACFQGVDDLRTKHECEWPTSRIGALFPGYALGCAFENALESPDITPWIVIRKKP